MGKPSDLVQGTLDLLILKTISLEPKHGWAIAKRIQQISGDTCSKSSKDRSIPLYIDSNRKPGLRLNGWKAIQGEKLSTTH
jgi:hypothetical protein